MKELIKITEHNGKQAVSARELHAFLGAKKDFTDWIKYRIAKYGFIENEDFEVFHKIGENPQGGRPQIEYALTIDCAKELAMVEGNAKGKQARLYFIECEKKLQELALIPKSQAEIALMHSQILVEQEKRLSTVEVKLDTLIQEKEEAEKYALLIERSAEPMPEESTRAKVNRIVRTYATAKNLGYETVWRMLYDKMLYTYKINLKARRKYGESTIDCAQRIGAIDKLYVIASNVLI